MRCRSFLFGVTTTFVYVHAAAAKDPVHIDFGGYRPASNDYCISAESVQGVPINGFLWRFTTGGGQSKPVGLAGNVDLTTSPSIELFPAINCRPRKIQGLRQSFRTDPRRKGDLQRAKRETKPPDMSIRGRPRAGLIPTMLLHEIEVGQTISNSAVDSEWLQQNLAILHNRRSVDPQ